MEPGLFVYESFCVECGRVQSHLHGECLVCRPVGYPRPPLEPPEVVMAQAMVLREKARRRR